MNLQIFTIKKCLKQIENEKNYYLQVFSKECKYTEKKSKKVIGLITEDLQKKMEKKRETKKQETRKKEYGVFLKMFFPISTKNTGGKGNKISTCLILIFTI